MSQTTVSRSTNEEPHLHVSMFTLPEVYAEAQGALKTVAIVVRQKEGELPPSKSNAATGGDVQESYCWTELLWQKQG